MAQAKMPQNAGLILDELDQYLKICGNPLIYMDVISESLFTPNQTSQIYK